MRRWIRDPDVIQPTMAALGGQTLVLEGGPDIRVSSPASASIRPASPLTPVSDPPSARKRFNVSATAIKLFRVVESIMVPIHEREEKPVSEVKAFSFFTFHRQNCKIITFNVSGLMN